MDPKLCHFGIFSDESLEHIPRRNPDVDPSLQGLERDVEEFGKALGGLIARDGVDEGYYSYLAFSNEGYLRFCERYDTMLAIHAALMFSRGDYLSDSVLKRTYRPARDLCIKLSMIELMNGLGLKTFWQNVWQDRAGKKV